MQCYASKVKSVVCFFIVLVLSQSERLTPFHSVACFSFLIAGYEAFLRASYSPELPPGSKWPEIGSNKNIKM